jgi:hypothetical protein
MPRPPREKPKYEWPKARPAAAVPKAEPAPAEPPAPSARTPFGEVLLTYVSALVALLAIGLIVFIEMENRSRNERVAEELTRLSSAVEALEARASAPQATPQPAVQPLDFPTNDGTIDAIMALQKRIAALEDAAQTAASSPNAPLPGPAPLGATQLADGPTEDCIPIDTRFVALTGESYAICRTPEVITLTSITGESVTTDNGANVIEGGFQRLSFGTCTLLVISADVEGFAELRVTCS